MLVPHPLMRCERLFPCGSTFLCFRSFKVGLVLGVGRFQSRERRLCLVYLNLQGFVSGILFRLCLGLRNNGYTAARMCLRRCMLLARRLAYPLQIYTSLHESLRLDMSRAACISDIL